MNKQLKKTVIHNTIIATNKIIKMEELEKLLIEEIEANIETTFLYQFHEKNFFDREKFQLLIVNVNKMATIT